MGDPNLRLLVSLPALDEELTIADVVERIPREIPGISSVDVLVVDDGSTDATAERAAQVGATVVRHRVNRGVGGAFHTALAYAIDHGADLIVTIDADGQFDPADIPRLIEPVVEGRADFSTASRFKDPEIIPEMPGLKLWGNRMMSWLVSRLCRDRFYDVSCGFRCYSRRAALQLHLLGHFTYTQEVFINLAFKHVPIVEVPIAVRGEREFGKSRVASNLFRYAYQTAQIILRTYRDYNPMRFFGAIASSMLAVAGGLGAFALVHYLQAARISPHKWAVFTGGGLVAMAFLMLLLGVVGDMMNRHRVYLEELLYHRRREGASRPVLVERGDRDPHGRPLAEPGATLSAPQRP